MITITQCPCGGRGCSDYHLVGIGKFMQGSGFTEAEAQRIADLLNGADPEQYVPIPEGPDVARIEAWGRVTSPQQALGLLIGNSDVIGSDPYYRDINDALWTMAERVTGEKTA